MKLTKKLTILKLALKDEYGNKEHITTTELRNFIIKVMNVIDSRSIANYVKLLRAKGWLKQIENSRWYPQSQRMIDGKDFINWDKIYGIEEK